jgi:hypothetical protein
MVVLVDDTYWVDPACRRVLLFVCATPVLPRATITLTRREDDTDFTVRSA